MTEAEWMTCEDPLRMMLIPRDQTRGDRKYELFHAACWRTAWHRMTDGRTKQHVELLERYADGLVPEDEWRIADRATTLVVRDLATVTDEGGAEAAAGTVRYETWGVRDDTAVVHVEGALQCRFLRDIFGNPFRPVLFAPRWKTETAVALAAGIYADRAFDRLPVLADALEEAGCDHLDILAHCRGPGPHVRGCWVVDGVLGKG
jgi:hypothetical protein